MNTESNNTDNFDIRQMREAWIEMGKALGMQPSSDGNPEDLKKKKTDLDRLRNRYQVFWTACLLLGFGTFMIFSTNSFGNNRLNIWLGVAYAVYFLTASGMDFWLWRGLGTIDPLTLTVSDIADKALFYRKRHLQFMAVLIPMAIALIGFTGYVFSSEMFFLNGMIAGVICGVIIGIIQFRRFMSCYHNLSDQ